MSLSSELTRLIRDKPIDQAALDIATLYVIDTLACAYGARRTKQGSKLLEWYRSAERDAGRRAFLTGSLVHVLEMDDLHRESVTHPGCAVIPAAWSVAAREGIRGRRFLTAVLRGYEAVCRIGNAVGPAHYSIWHNTATCGPFGSALAVADLLGLDPQQTTWALGNAGTQACGLWQFLDEGAMSKHLHAGRAAESGLLAAELAAHDFTGPVEILEGQKGFFRAMCPDAQPARVLAGPDDPWQLLMTSIKPWPSCRHTHPAIEAALLLHVRAAAQQIEQIRVETYRAALDLCDNAMPASEYQAKFSVQHCAAAALTDGEINLGSFDAAARQRLAPLCANTTLSASSVHDDGYPDRWGARLTVLLTGGDTIVSDCTACKGDPESPVTAAEVCAKAAMLFEHAGLPNRRAQRLVDAVLALGSDGRLPDTADLFAPA